jgi:hypothetical protein
VNLFNNGKGKSCGHKINTKRREGKSKIFHIYSIIMEVISANDGLLTNTEVFSLIHEQRKARKSLALKENIIVLQNREAIEIKVIMKNI